MQSTLKVLGSGLQPRPFLVVFVPLLYTVLVLASSSSHQGQELIEQEDRNSLEEATLSISDASTVSSPSNKPKRPFQLQPSHNGELCVSECSKKRKSNNWCFISKQNHGVRNILKWRDTCSPDPRQMLSLEAEAVAGVLSTHGIPCGSECSQGGNTMYFWCRTIQKWKPSKFSRVKSWDFCSPAPGFDFRLNQCSSKCDYHKNGYKWCFHFGRGSGQGYCSTVTVANAKHKK